MKIRKMITGTIVAHVMMDNNGGVIVNGSNSESVLNLSGVNSLTKATDNTAGYGWFAVNTGELTLPLVSIDPGDNSYNWGEGASDTSIDLVNSLGMSFTNVTTCSSDRPFLTISNSLFPMVVTFLFMIHLSNLLIIHIT